MSTSAPETSPPARPLARRLGLALLLLAALWVQLVTVGRTQTEVPLRADAGEYFSYAFNLRHYGVYSIDPTWNRAPEAHPPRPDAYRPPGYPLFLAALGMPEPTEAFVHRVELVQAVLGALSVLLAFLLARRFLGFGWALAAGTLTALSPHLAIFASLLLSENLFTCLLLAALLATVHAMQRGGRTACVLAGLAWAACTLVRSTSELFPPLLLAAVWLLPALRAWRMRALLGFAVFVAVLSPWALRNLSPQVSKPESSLMVKALAHGSYPGFMYEEQAQSFGYPYRFDPQADAIAHDLPSVLRHIAGRFRAQPVRYLRWYLIGKPGYFLAWGHVQGWDILVYPVAHTPWFEDPLFELLRALALLAHWPLMLLGLLGGLLAWSPRALAWLEADERRAARLAAALLGYGIAFHVVVAPFPRYGMPFHPLLFVLAMLALAQAWRRLPKRARGAK